MLRCHRRAERRPLDGHSQGPPARRDSSGYEIVINGGRTPTGFDALAWAKRGEALGAGELVVNSIDADGTRQGYEIELDRMIADAVGIPVIASGGAGKPEHLYEVLPRVTPTRRSWPRWSTLANTR